MMPKSYSVLVLPSVFLLFWTAAALANPVAYFWSDDMEGDVSGWHSEDLTASTVPHFHVDTYLAYEGDYSWWCGTFEYDEDGGYGNLWDDRLELPPIEIGAVAVENVSWGAIKSMFDGRETQAHGGPRDPVQPILTFAYRYDSEPGYDYTYVQAESNGVYVNLNSGYNGAQPWMDMGPDGFCLSGYDDPLRIRFRFVSDGAWSEEDGLYPVNGGAFHVDNILVYDFATGSVLFYDDVESGGLCTPSVPEPAGDYWHLIDRKCPALSDPHSWWCGDDADTGLVPPNLHDALYTPLIDIHDAPDCTCHFAMHFAIPTVDDDYLLLLGTVNGTDYYSIGGWWGDFGSCDGWGGTAYNFGFDIGQFGYCHQGGMAFVMHTTDNGCGPGAGGDAGAMIDDFWLEAGWPSAQLREAARPWDAYARPGYGPKLIPETRYGRRW
jgi:hypothetical protein